MTRTKEYITPDLKERRSSMCYDSGTLIASCVIDDTYDCEILVCGSVRVVDKKEGGVYKCASQMPDWLLAEFRSGVAWHNDDLFIDDNNWFELFIRNRQTDEEYSNVVDFNKYNPKDVWAEIEKQLEYAKECID